MFYDAYIRHIVGIVTFAALGIFTHLYLLLQSHTKRSRRMIHKGFTHAVT